MWLLEISHRSLGWRQKTVYFLRASYVCDNRRAVAYLFRYGFALCGPHCASRHGAETLIVDGYLFYTYAIAAHLWQIRRFVYALREIRSAECYCDCTRVQFAYYWTVFTAGLLKVAHLSHRPIDYYSETWTSVQKWIISILFATCALWNGCVKLHLLAYWLDRHEVNFKLIDNVKNTNFTLHRICWCVKKFI